MFSPVLSCFETGQELASFFARNLHSNVCWSVTYLEPLCSSWFTQANTHRYTPTPSSGSIDLTLHICRGNKPKPGQCTVIIKWSKVALHPSRWHCRWQLWSVGWLPLSVSCSALCTFNTRHLLGSYHWLKPKVLSVRTTPNHIIGLSCIEGWWQMNHCFE